MDAPEKSKRPKQRNSGRKPGSLNKKTLAKIAAAEKGLAEIKTGKQRLATDFMDEMITWLRNLIAVLTPFEPNGMPRPGYNAELWFKTLTIFQGFLTARAPYQSARLSAVQIMPMAPAQRTQVNVTILNERGDKVYSDVPEELREQRDDNVIEHEPSPDQDEEAA